jgi:plastocyanin
LILAIASSAALADNKKAPAPAGKVGKIIGKVTVTEADGKPAASVDVIVYVVGPKETLDPAGKAKPYDKVVQQGRKFNPDLLDITQNDWVDFPNFDKYQHNVFSQSPGRTFDLGSMNYNEAKQKQFKQSGVVDVYCNIHPEMAATIVVLPNHFHTRTKNGVYEIPNVPVGDVDVFAYTRRATKPAQQKGVKVTDDPKGTTVNLAIQRGAEADHLNKFGEKYKPGGKAYP